VEKRLAAALALEHPTERKLAVVALIDELVQRIGFRAIVIGGLAVEFWTHGAYTTSDIDLYLPHGPAVDDLLGDLGFQKRGRHWVHADAGLFVEAPASFPAPEEEIAEVELQNGARVLLLSAEDVLVYRLHEFLGTGHSDVAEQSVALLASPDIERARVIERAEQEGLLPTLAAIETLSQRLRRGETVETYELHEIADKLRAEG
jgi:hypothetical protein